MKYVHLIIKLMNIATSLFIMAHLGIIMAFGAIEIYESSKAVLIVEASIIGLLIIGNIAQFCGSFTKSVRKEA